MLNLRRIRYGDWSVGLVLCLALAATACDLDILKQEAPSRIDAGNLEDPANATLLVRSAVSQFGCALGLHIYATGLVSDELADGSLQEVFYDYDRRTLSASRGQYASGTCDDGGAPGSYMAVSAARFQADRVLELLNGWTDAQVPNRSELIARVAAYGGYSLVLLGESMCSAAIDVGPELSREELFQEAVERFDRATQEPGVSDSILNLARVGRARALLSLGQFDRAAADAALVPDGFEVSATYSDLSIRRRNRLFVALFRNTNATVGPAYRNLNDPRVRIVDTGQTASDAQVPLFQPEKYDAASAPIPIATWEEARLIEAEAALAAGDTTVAVGIVNDLRTRPEVGLSPYDPATDGPVMAQIIQERTRELFLEGHRLGDLIRYGIMPDPQPGTPFFRGGVYGEQLCFPLPVQETGNNPNVE